MCLPRSHYVQGNQEGVYHCFSRCVRRAFLCGFDVFTQRDFSHRKAWLVERLRFLASIFSIEVCAYAVMGNHYHTILRTRPDIATGWSDREVATRWLTLIPRHRAFMRSATSPSEKEISDLVDCPERIAQLRLRLCNLSWFMGQLNEFIARKANKEDSVKGRFWESRFKCQVLLDDAAIVTCMVYVDLNPFRAGQAGTLEESDFTSIQERIRIWQKDDIAAAVSPGPPFYDGQSDSFEKNVRTSDGARKLSNPSHQSDSGRMMTSNHSARHTSWLCPIQSDSRQRGILQMTALEYLDLVDKSARMIRSDKHGAMDDDLAPILLRIGARTEAWHGIISHFGSQFHLVAGLLSNLRDLADQLGQRWFKGTMTARMAFISSHV
jgi:hypothetical protein